MCLEKDVVLEIIVVVYLVYGVYGMVMFVVGCVCGVIFFEFGYDYDKNCDKN